MSQKPNVRCVVCGEIVRIRKRNDYSCWPAQHVNPETQDKCHGFYRESFERLD